MSRGEMNAYSKLWLGYKSKQQNRNCRYLKKIRIKGAPGGSIAQHAAAELKRGLTAMLDLEPEVLFEEEKEPAPVPKSQIIPPPVVRQPAPVAQPVGQPALRQPARQPV